MTKSKESEKLNIDSTEYNTRLSQKFIGRKGFVPVNLQEVASFIPGTIVEIRVKEGDIVEEGDDLLVLEAMKMKNRIRCEVKGKIIKIYVKVGDKVPKGKLLLEIGS